MRCGGEARWWARGGRRGLDDEMQKKGGGGEGGVGGQVFQRKPACVVTGIDGNDE